MGTKIKVTVQKDGINDYVFYMDKERQEQLAGLVNQAKNEEKISDEFYIELQALCDDSL